MKHLRPFFITLAFVEVLVASSIVPIDLVPGWSAAWVGLVTAALIYIGDLVVLPRLGVFGAALVSWALSYFSLYAAPLYTPSPHVSVTGALLGSSMIAMTDLICRTWLRRYLR